MAIEGKGWKKVLGSEGREKASSFAAKSPGGKKGQEARRSRGERGR